MDSSPIDLAEVYGELLNKLPAHEDDEFIFSRENVPRPPSELSTSRLWFRRPGFKFYNSYPVPAVDICIDKEGCSLLAVLILACVLHPDPESIDLHLVHHDMQLDLLRLRVTDTWPDFRSTPESFSYIAESPVSKNPKGMGSEILHPPWTENGAPPSELPMVEITTRDELGTSGKSHWPEGCDTVVAFGSRRASVRMAELLLNLALEDHIIDEVQFWGLFFYRSVAVGSAEFVIWLPGGFGFDDED